MGALSDLLARRAKKKKNTPAKTASLAQQSARGDLSVFTGVFSLEEISPAEKEQLKTILEQHLTEGHHEALDSDLSS